MRLHALPEALVDRVRAVLGVVVFLALLPALVVLAVGLVVARAADRLTR